MHHTMDEVDERYAVYGHPSSVVSNNSTPQVSAPPYVMSMRATPRRHEWSTDLFHCLDDPALCFVTCCCPCITFGHIAEILDKAEPPCASSGAIYGLLALTGFACLYSCTYRSKMRAHYHLKEAPCMDCLVHFCCETCALSQEYRQLQNLGFDLSIGWEGNMERQRHAVTVAPTISTGMTR